MRMFEESDRTDTELTEQIRQVHTELDGHPGVRRVRDTLRECLRRTFRLHAANRGGLPGGFIGNSGLSLASGSFIEAGR